MQIALLSNGCKETQQMKSYNGHIPVCGVFCDGCPTYTRDKKPCLEAEINKTHCDKYKTFHLCCIGIGITHCFLSMPSIPLHQIQKFRNRWLKYGQNYIENQKLIKTICKWSSYKFLIIK